MLEEPSAVSPLAGRDSHKRAKAMVSRIAIPTLCTLSLVVVRHTLRLENRDVHWPQLRAALAMSTPPPPLRTQTPLSWPITLPPPEARDDIRR